MVLSWLLTCSLGADKDRISSRESPGWNWMRSASICLVLKGRQGEVQEGSGRGGQRAKGKTCPRSGLLGMPRMKSETVQGRCYP